MVDNTDEPPKFFIDVEVQVPTDAVLTFVQQEE